MNAEDNAFFKGAEEEEPYLFACEWCGNPIYIGDTYYYIGGTERVCKECIESWREVADDC